MSDMVKMLSGMSGHARRPDDAPKSAEEAGEQFELMMANLLLKEMRKSMPQDGMFSSSEMSMFNEMLDQELAQRMVEGPGLGLKAQIADAIRSAGRENADVILVGELRDQETIEAALTLAETGHLTFGTLHTSDAVQTINRVIDVFPPHQQQQVRTQLSFSLEGVLSQQLLPLASGRGRALTAELLRMTPGIRALIRDGKAHQIYSQIQTGGRLGMCTMSAALAHHVKAGRVDIKDAERAVSDPTELRSLVRAA